MTDEQLEVEIQRARNVFAESTTREQMHERWLELAALIDQRSPQQIERMKRARGLRAP